eukprot:NODE_10996_length_1315_cov_4.350168.p1 GENE.NODE_10996_length_1315_cov_4.350168~~NODE_10996_length_1315_cov_4.350168.p1  ORF type:complete len:251 (+),score=38.22 NODE_10996_length_1315_cov_4.350168:153-905(+)
MAASREQDQEIMTAIRELPLKQEPEWSREAIQLEVAAGEADVAEGAAAVLRRELDEHDGQLAAAAGDVAGLQVEFEKCSARPTWPRALPLCYGGSLRSTTRKSQALHLSSPTGRLSISPALPVPAGPRCDCLPSIRPRALSLGCRWNSRSRATWLLRSRRASPSYPGRRRTPTVTQRRKLLCVPGLDKEVEKITRSSCGALSLGRWQSSRSRARGPTWPNALLLTRGRSLRSAARGPTRRRQLGELVATL